MAQRFPKEVEESILKMPQKDRSYLTYEILLRCSYRDETFEIGDRSKDKHLGIDRLLDKKVFQTFYPMHEVSIQVEISKIFEKTY